MATLSAADPTTRTTGPRWDAIVVAGGRASRLGGIDKTALVFEGRSLLQCALDSVRFADRVSVVGYDGSLSASSRVRLTLERPRWGGPAAALLAGLSSLGDDTREFTAVLAGDLPRAAAGVALLVDELGSPALRDGAIAVDSNGRRQYLLAIYRTTALLAAAQGHDRTESLSMRALVDGLDLTEVPVRDDVCADVDTPLDAAALGISIPSSHSIVRTG